METTIHNKIEELRRICELRNKEKIDAERSMIVAIEESHKYFNMTLEYENKIRMLELKNDDIKKLNILLHNDNRYLEDRLHRMHINLERMKEVLKYVILISGTIMIIFIAYHINFTV